MLAPRTISVKSGFAKSNRTTPTVRLSPTRSCWAAVLRTNPVPCMASRTRARVEGATNSGLLRTFEAVPTDTCAICAMSRSVARAPLGPGQSLGAFDAALAHVRGNRRKLGLPIASQLARIRWFWGRTVN